MEFFLFKSTNLEKVLIIGLAGCLIALIIETAMVAEYVDVPKPNSGGQKVAVFAFMLHVPLYQMPVYALIICSALSSSMVFSSMRHHSSTHRSTPLFPLALSVKTDSLYSRIYPQNVRARGVALATFTYFALCIVSMPLLSACATWLTHSQAYVTPGATALDAIGWRYFLGKLKLHLNLCTCKLSDIVKSSSASPSVVSSSWPFSTPKPRANRSKSWKSSLVTRSSCI